MPEAPPPADGLAVSERTRLRRHAERGSHRREDLDALLACGFLCHLGVLVDGAPVVVPTVYGVREDTLYLHASVASRSLTQAPEQPVCVTVTQVDGVVLARSVFSHSVNYRSAMIFGVPRKVVDEAEVLVGLRSITEQVAPGQWDYARTPSRKELAATGLIALALDEVSVKSRGGPPMDDTEGDAALPLWAGVLPLVTSWGQPSPDPELAPGLVPPPHVVRRAGTRHGVSPADSDARTSPVSR
jgi:nitroimidazol reductase NimA-like FMN-containing flavoprotein (pyridoxamine 5'-phosphate oxidase superfamily)